MSTETQTRLDQTSTEPLPPNNSLDQVSKSAGKLGWSYSGIAWTDRDGRAVVSLPIFARLHDAGFAYDLEPIGSESHVTLACEVIDRCFTIASERPHVKVAWRLTAYRPELDEDVRE